MQRASAGAAATAPAQVSAAPVVLRLRLAGEAGALAAAEAAAAPAAPAVPADPAPRVHWDDNVVNNEGLNRKKSNKCCIYHRPKAFDESSDESSGSDNEDEFRRRYPAFAGKKHRRSHKRGEEGGHERCHGHDHGHGHGHQHDDVAAGPKTG
jgi:protein phosphatase 1 regulatory subunit 11